VKSVNTAVIFAQVRAGPGRLLLTGLLCLFVTGHAARAADWLPAGNAARPTVTGSVEALMLWRSPSPDRPLYFETANPANVPLDAGGIGTAMAAGPRYAIEWSGDGERAIEVNYFSVGDFTGSALATSPGGGLEQADILGFSFPDVTAAAAVSAAAIQSFELNRRLPLDRFDGDFLYGFRWVEWSDGLAVADTTVTGAQTGADVFFSETISSLYGAQVGLDLVLLGSRERAWIEGVGKAGVYYDNAVQHSFVDSVSVSQITRSTAATADTTSFVGELGFTGCLRLSDHWVARTGFTMFWLGNVAAAADQLSANNLYSREIVSRIDTGANVFLYGLNLGLEAGW
jgi:hypothetical protein